MKSKEELNALKEEVKTLKEKLSSLIKTIEELNALKEEVKTLKEKLSALTGEELEQITGGVALDDYLRPVTYPIYYDIEEQSLFS